ncbi:Selenide, water dikinase [Planctomycetes bacterium MalM25]|nr:Selenide, water dikinase [Planctomycetes bacterium MalM25]
MQEQLPKHDLVLLGAGHTNAHLIRMWRMNPLPGIRLTCVSNHGTAAYSGMLPGVLAGDHQPDESQIDLVRLSAATGVRFLRAEVSGLNLPERRLLFEDRPPLSYDYLSVGIGSLPTRPPGCDALGLSIKPMQTFLERLNRRLDALAETVGGPIRLVVAGGGAGGVEIACCLKQHLTGRSPGSRFELSLVEAGDDLLSGMPLATRRLARRALEKHGIEIVVGRRIVATDAAGRLRFESGEEREADLILWATSASAPPLLGRLGLDVDERGFIRTHNTLQTVTSDRVYAVGDAGSPVNGPTTKAGVYAVRQGPVLWRNLRNQLQGRPLETWRPQPSFLSLLNTGDGRAILTYKGLSTHARWCRRLKARIDRRFMLKHQDYTPASMAAPPSPSKEEAMHCGGCGCKLPGDILSRVLKRLEVPLSPRVVVGLEPPDDVAMLRPTAGKLLGVSTDFFSSFLDDPYALGRIAALNALSDLYAKRVQPTAALAIATVPYGGAPQQEEHLTQLLAGGLRELREAGADLVGGHTTEGPQTTVGFTLLGDVEEAATKQMAQLKPGDLLMLTKAIGTGALLAGDRLARCQHDWMEALLRSMLTSNRQASETASRLGASAMTDVTGFGLAGHLLELLRQSGVGAELSLDRLVLLPGAEHLISQGVESTLAPGNRSVEGSIDRAAALQGDPRYRSLFDPQTSGGLLAGVPEANLPVGPDGPEETDGWVRIGRVVDRADGKSVIRVR